MASRGDEGRGKRRNSPGIGKRDWIRGCPNGATRAHDVRAPREGGERRELKHLITCRRRKKDRFPE